jgi:hypothetical protein
MQTKAIVVTVSPFEVILWPREWRSRRGGVGGREGDHERPGEISLDPDPLIDGSHDGGEVGGVVVHTEGVMESLSERELSLTRNVD